MCRIRLPACFVKPLKQWRDDFKIFEPLQVTFFDFFLFFFAHKEHLNTNVRRAQVAYFNILIFFKVFPQKQSRAKLVPNSIEIFAKKCENLQKIARFFQNFAGKCDEMRNFANEIQKVLCYTLL